ncbi:hypothetical protein CVV26_01010 [Candidatus Kuenenbacteria bacterium HGW-Kuenenbacteria-1]|uniref:Uncharacterized protein n=1 Tax=Candidatus Kuenenbacteria bacterium HGW-Kuenenbacteria-1 TaxID=2013812 RepID=A0A2N1UNY3_9BACT|nr:MAG: hypothetical protein CVV26_01010 [Candidatus Kuenenbacteria bacterium HGW-Kuenenbacteria-1]
MTKQNKKIKLCKGVLQYAPMVIIFCQIFVMVFLFSSFSVLSVKAEGGNCQCNGNITTTIFAKGTMGLFFTTEQKTNFENLCENYKGNFQNYDCLGIINVPISTIKTENNCTKDYIQKNATEDIKAKLGLSGKGSTATITSCQWTDNVSSSPLPTFKTTNPENGCCVKTLSNGSFQCELVNALNLCPNIENQSFEKGKICIGVPDCFNISMMEKINTQPVTPSPQSEARIEQEKIRKETMIKAEAKKLAKIPTICWQKSECISPNVFKENSSPCQSPYGKCYMTPKGSTLQVEIPGYDEKGQTNISQYISAIYKFIIILATILAVIMIMIAGVRWMTAMGNQGQLDSAKTMITNSLIGLVLALGSWFILNSINPALVKNEMKGIAMIRTEPLKMQQREVPDWGDITFCRRDCGNYGGPLATIYCACGEPYKNCTGVTIRAEELSEKICIAKDKKVIGVKEVSLIKISNPQKYTGEKTIKAVSKDYNCGWVYMKNNELFLGRNCHNENKDCVIFWEEGFIKDEVPIRDSIIGNYKKSECY